MTDESRVHFCVSYPTGDQNGDTRLTDILAVDIRIRDVTHLFGGEVQGTGHSFIEGRRDVDGRLPAADVDVALGALLGHVPEIESLQVVVNADWRVRRRT
jgi:hypothetical protein